MKAVYMMLSGLILSIMATLAMAGLISVSELIRPQVNNLKPIESKTKATSYVTKEGYAHHQQSPDDCYDDTSNKEK